MTAVTNIRYQISKEIDVQIQRWVRLWEKREWHVFGAMLILPMSMMWSPHVFSTQPGQPGSSWTTKNWRWAPNGEEEQSNDEWRQKVMKRNKEMMKGTTCVRYIGFIHRGNKESCCLRSCTFLSWKLMIEMLGGNPFPSDIPSGTQPVNHMVIKPTEACAYKYCHCLIGKPPIVFLPLDCRHVLASTRRYW